LFIILRSRSGATLALIELINVAEWTDIFMHENLGYLLIVLLFRRALSYFLILKVGKIFDKRFANVTNSFIVKITITMIVILVFLFTGLTGLIILIVTTSIKLYLLNRV
jgi:hypothetical protein